MLMIRDFHPKDLPSVSAIVSDVFNRDYNPNFYLSLYEGWKSGFLVSEDLKGIVGVLASMISGPKEARILLMAVRPQFRGKGIGTGMLREFISRCFVSGMKTVILEVRISNKMAIQFYNNQGFDIITMLPNYYEDGEAGYLMRKAL
jgi:ribosomal-protein-alanine N-acetyltransferase